MAHVFKIFLIGVFCCCSSIKAQTLSATDISERSVRRYRSVVQQNWQIVRLIEYTFSQRGVPKHLRNLAIIESDLDKNTVSGAGASGIWQFMTEHANNYGLSEQDRSDIYKSTRTAVNSLINLYNKFGNWVTVVAAYNCGEGNIKKAMDRAGSKKYTDFAPYLPAETQNHVRKYLNACYATGELDQVLADYYKTAPTTVSVQKPLAKVPATPAKAFKKNNGSLSQTTINSAYKIEVIAQVLNTSVQKIIDWNPELRKNLHERGESILYLPRDLMLDFEISRNKILGASLNK